MYLRKQAILLAVLLCEGQSILYIRIYIYKIFAIDFEEQLQVPVVFEYHPVATAVALRKQATIL